MKIAPTALPGAGKKRVLFLETFLALVMAGAIFILTAEAKTTAQNARHYSPTLVVSKTANAAQSPHDQEVLSLIFRYSYATMYTS